MVEEPTCRNRIPGTGRPAGRCSTTEVTSMIRVLPTSVAVAVAAVLAGCASTPAEDDPVQIKLNDLDGRVARIERVVANQSLVQLAQNLDAVQAETRRLRGRIEELENSNETLKKQLASATARGGAYAPGGS